MLIQPKIMAAAAAGVDEVEEEDVGPAEANFDYLLSMPIQSLTLEKVCILSGHLRRSA